MEGRSSTTWSFYVAVLMKIGIPVMLPGIVGTFSVLFANAMGAYASAYALTSSNYNLVAIRIGSLIKGDILRSQS